MVEGEERKPDEVVFRGRTSLDPGELEILMEQYKLFVDTSERLVARRQVANTFFLSLNTLALTLVVLIAKEVQASPLVATGVVVISLAAIMLCVAWKTLVRSYAQLNRGKFTVIDCLENRLPAALFRAEWAGLAVTHCPRQDRHGSSAHLRQFRLRSRCRTPWQFRGAG